MGPYAVLEVQPAIHELGDVSENSHNSVRIFGVNPLEEEVVHEYRCLGGLRLTQSARSCLCGDHQCSGSECDLVTALGNVIDDRQEIDEIKHQLWVSWQAGAKELVAQAAAWLLSLGDAIFTLYRGVNDRDLVVFGKFAAASI